MAFFLELRLFLNDPSKVNCRRLMVTTGKRGILYTRIDLATETIATPSSSSHTDCGLFGITVMSSRSLSSLDGTARGTP